MQQLNAGQSLCHLKVETALSRDSLAGYRKTELLNVFYPRACTGVFKISFLKPGVPRIMAVHGSIEIDFYWEVHSFYAEKIAMRTPRVQFPLGKLQTQSRSLAKFNSVYYSWENNHEGQQVSKVVAICTIHVVIPNTTCVFSQRGNHYVAVFQDMQLQLSDNKPTA